MANKSTKPPKHGQQLLIEAINALPDEKKIGKTIIEIGSTREFLPGQNSSEDFIIFCKKNKMKFISVDVDPKCTRNVREIAKKHKFRFYKAYTQKAEDFLKNHKATIDFIYLDGYDYYHSNHSKERQDRYKELMDASISPDDKKCHQMHLECCQNMLDKIGLDSLIAIDDILDEKSSRGKGVTAVPFLLENGLKKKAYKYKAMLLQK